MADKMMIPRIAERNGPANIAARITSARIECALTDVKGIRDLPPHTLNDAELEARVGAAERALLELFVFVRGSK